MKDVRAIMGMPVTVEIVGTDVTGLEPIFEYFTHIDNQFSPYKDTSEVSRINRHEIFEQSYSTEMQEILRLAEETRRATNGYFDITKPNGTFDPSGIVKGWAINNAARLAFAQGHTNFWIEAGGDIQTSGTNEQGTEWSVGILSPFNQHDIVKVIYPRGAGVATSGTYIRGRHIYDPFTQKPVETTLISLTVVGLNVYEADRFATAAFAMGAQGIAFIESLPGFEGYAVDRDGVATMTSEFTKLITL